MTSDDKKCHECGFPVMDGEFHPYAACLMFKACGNSDTVTANLKAVVVHGYSIGFDEGIALYKKQQLEQDK